MRKFLIVLFALIVSLFLFDFLYYRVGVYIPNNKKIEVISYTNNREMFIKTDNGYENVIVKGVNLGGFIPNSYVTDYSIDYDKYYEWLTDIYEMGANTIRLDTIFNDKFYDAFYDFNEKHDRKLYLIQGINLDTYSLNSHINGFDKEYYGELITQAENAVDVVHGRKKLTLAKHGKGTYKKDVSSYVIAYIVGSEWMEDTILYTNNTLSNKAGYVGKYISTNQDASSFETMLAKVMDHLISYEARKYAETHSISFINTPETDPVAIIPEVVFDIEKETYNLYPNNLKYFYHKAVKLDLGHLNGVNGYNGLFAAYNISSYYPNYLSYENKEYDDTYASYISSLVAHHDVPVLVTEFAYSTSRGVSTLVDDTYGNFGGMTEQEQGESLVKAYHAIINSNAAGGVIATWQDEWDKRSWNTIEKVDTTRTIYWSDAQTTNQGLGLLSFEPGEKTSVCYVDGNVSEWKEKDKVLENNDLSLSMKQDEKYLYFYIKKKTSNDVPIYIPIDTTSKSGSKYASNYNLSFDRDVDFLMVIDGDNSEIFVQEYYNVLNAVDGYEVYNKNSYVNKPLKDSSLFTSINLLIEPYSVNTFSRTYGKATLVNTGKLIYGNANPKSSNFNSQADYYEVNGNIEIRIPWGLLNFSDPSDLQIHDDYYENYGVENTSISKIYVGAGIKSNITLEPFKLKRWGEKATYHERLKNSYYIVKNDWRNL